MDFTLAEMEKVTGANRRALQFWTGEGVIMTTKATAEAGRGVHRRYSRDEAIIACAVRAFADRRLSVRELTAIAESMRRILASKEVPKNKNESSGSQAIENAVAGKWRVYLSFSNNAAGKWSVSTTTDPGEGTTPEMIASLLGKKAAEHLDAPDSFACQILLNTYTKKIPKA